MCFCACIFAVGGYYDGGGVFCVFLLHKLTLLTPSYNMSFIFCMWNHVKMLNNEKNLIRRL